MRELLHLFRQPALTPDKEAALKSSFNLAGLKTELCFNIETDKPLTADELAKLRWLLAETFEPENFGKQSFFARQNKQRIIEVGPRLNFTTPSSTNAVSICHACGLRKITKIEISRRYLLPENTAGNIQENLTSAVHDIMTECPYPAPLKTFKTGKKPDKVKLIPLIQQGENALIDANKELGLGMDKQDFQYYLYLFTEVLKRNPTDVELFQLAQANSEHSRHHFFKGQLIIDGKKMPRTLFDIVKAAYQKNPGNSVIAFHDNSSAIQGFEVWTILPVHPGYCSPYTMQRLTYHIIFTAETHNFPSGVAPFPGAETGTGGRIRDIQAVGRGGLMIAGTAAYCVGALRITGYNLPWEHPEWLLAAELATPLKILIRASDGASDYGNKIGEPVILGFARSNELMVDGRRRAWFKPIMFTGGIGQMDARHVKKNEPQKGYKVIILGGPNHRIGMGGGSASSMIQGENKATLDFNAVQRGDAEMEQKDKRVIDACIAMGDKNIIVAKHDLGAGGNCNAIPEGVDPVGGIINLQALPLGDLTLSARETWGNESQERYLLIIKAENLSEFIAICQREKCPYAVVGEITGDGQIVVYDAKTRKKVVNLNLKQIFNEVPQKTFEFKTQKRKLPALRLPKDLTISQALELTQRLLAVGSKRFLTTKVDRSVTGLIAQQQCLGPLQITLSDYAAVANSHFQTTGAATSIGERPILELINPAAMARMSAAEALTNLVWARITGFKDIRFSANWMWAAKLDDEGARLYKAANALNKFLLALDGPVIDGGKDSLSMATKINHPDKTSEMVKAPGTLVMSAYAAMPDIRKKVTADIKEPGKSKLMFIDLAKGKMRLGGSALAQVHEQVGNQTPDVVDPQLVKAAFNAIQHLIDRNLILAGHDRSDGGLIQCLLEMAYAGNCGLNIDFRQNQNTKWLDYLFNEELGLVIEYLPKHEKKIRNILARHGLQGYCHVLGKTVLEYYTGETTISLENYGRTIFCQEMQWLRDRWEETSYQLDLQQANPDCVNSERKVNIMRSGPHYSLSFTPKPTHKEVLARHNKPSIAVIREEGSNGDAEMRAAFFTAGFDVWDVTMTDLASGRVSLDQFRGVAFVGGFSYADVFTSAKGWAGVIRFNQRVKNECKKFYERNDTFSLGVCNGGQLELLLGWVPWTGIKMKKQPRFIRNLSGRFESRFSTVRIEESPAIMLRGMAGSTLGVWVAHGEGRFHCPDESILATIFEEGLAPIRFTSDDRNTRFTELYPFNPNGSPYGVTALCSPDGRHLAMMPHPERLFLNWQWPYQPKSWKNLKASPWLQLFQNAREWCARF